MAKAKRLNRADRLNSENVVTDNFEVVDLVEVQGLPEASNPVDPKGSNLPDPMLINAIFKNDTNIRQVLSTNLQERSTDSKGFSDRAQTAFASFNPSSYSSTERARRNYLAPGENLAQAIHAVAENGVAAMRKSADQRTLRIHLGDELKGLFIASPAGKQAAGKIGLGPLLKHLRQKLADAPTLTNDPTRTACDAEAKANELLAKAEGKDESVGVDTAPTTLLVATPRISANGDSPSVKKFISSHVDDLLTNVASPEGPLLFNVEERAKVPDTEKSVDTFQLRAGASDVTSYHDFRCLHIAFEHIWTELFDDRIKSLGTQLYHEAVKLENFLRPEATTNLNLSISSIPDLLNLLRDIRELSNQAKDAMPNTASIPSISGALGTIVGAIVGGATTKDAPNEPESDYVTVVTGYEENGSPITRQVAVIPGAMRLSRLLDEIELRLMERYLPACTVISCSVRSAWQWEEWSWQQIGFRPFSFPLCSDISC